MNDSIYHLNDMYKEIIYQTLIVLVLLVSFSFELDESHQQSLQSLFKVSNLAFFANYLIAAMVINYILLPVLYYKKRMFQFIVALCVLLTAVILLDEYVLEQIFFPDTRGTHFPGIVFTLIETLPTIIIIVAFKLAWDSNRKQTELERVKGLMQETEIQLMKSQINPHFLFNNLNNLYAYAIENSPKTPSIILELSAVLRYMLYDCNTNFVALSTEVKHLENYVALHQLQIGNSGESNFTKDISQFHFSIPPLILIVFVENAFKHSTASLSKDIEVDISLQVSAEGKLTFLCRNNYSRQYQPIGSTKGIGLENVRKRLELQYPAEHELAIQDDGHIFQVILTMQLKTTEP